MEMIGPKYQSYFISKLNPVSRCTDVLNNVVNIGIVI